MKDEQFETLVSLINKVENSLTAKIDNIDKSLNAKIDNVNESLNAKIDNTEIHVILMINELRKDMNSNMRMIGRKIQTITDVIEQRYDDLKSDLDFVKDDITTLHALSKLDEAQHKEYDRILSQNNLV